MKSNRNQTRSGATFRNHQPSRGGDPRSIVRPTGEADDALFDIWFNDALKLVRAGPYSKDIQGYALNKDGKTSTRFHETPLGMHPGDGIVSPQTPANTLQKCLAGEGTTTAPPLKDDGAHLGRAPT